MEATYQRELGPSAKTIETHGEYRLPDYAGDIKKMLSSRARILPTGKFFADETVEFGGSVYYDFWYLDAENKLTHESFGSDYSFSCPRGSAADGGIDVVLTQLSLRPSGPRRVSAKATLEGRITLRESCPLHFSCEEEARVYKKEREITVGTRIFSPPMEREYAENIPVPAALGDQDAEVIFSEAQPMIERCEAQQGGVRCSGSIVCAAVLVSKGLAPVRICERFPFEETVACEDAVQGALASADMHLTSLTVQLHTDGEPRVTFSMICELSAVCEKNSTLSVVEDAFVGGCDSRLACECIAFDTFLGRETFRHETEVRIPLCEDGETAADGVFYTGVALKNPTLSAGTFSAEAEVTALVYALGEEGRITYGVKAGTAPISFALPQGAAPDGCEATLSAPTLFADAALCDEGLSVALSLQLTVSYVQKQEVSVAKGICACPRDDAERIPYFALHYPTEGESPWSVAKHYAVSPDALALSARTDAESGTVTLPSPILIDCR